MAYRHLCRCCRPSTFAALLPCCSVGCRRPFHHGASHTLPRAPVRPFCRTRGAAGAGQVPRPLPPTVPAAAAACAAGSSSRGVAVSCSAAAWRGGTFASSLAATSGGRGVATCSTGCTRSHRIAWSRPALLPYLTTPGHSRVRRISGDSNGGCSSNGDSRSTGDGAVAEPRSTGDGADRSGRANVGNGVGAVNHNGPGPGAAKESREDVTQVANSSCGIANGHESHVSPNLDQLLAGDAARLPPDAAGPPSPGTPVSTSAVLPSSQLAHLGPSKLNSDPRSSHGHKGGNSQNGNSNGTSAGPQPSPQPNPSSPRSVGDFTWEELHEFLANHVERFTPLQRNGMVPSPPDRDRVGPSAAEIPRPVLDHTEPFRDQLEHLLRTGMNITPCWGIGNASSGAGGGAGHVRSAAGALAAHLRDERYNVLLTCATPGSDGIMEAMCRHVAKNLGADILVLDARSLAELIGCGFRPRDPSTCHDIGFVRTLFPDLHAEWDVQPEVSLPLHTISRFLLGWPSYSLPPLNAGTVSDVANVQSVFDSVLDVLVAMPESKEFVKRGGRMAKRDQNVRPRILVFNDVERMTGAAEDTTLVEALVRAVKRQRAQGVPVCMVALYAPFSSDNATGQHAFRGSPSAELNRNSTVNNNSVALNLVAMEDLDFLRERLVFGTHFSAPVVLLSPATSLTRYGFEVSGQRLLALWDECTEMRLRQRNYEVNVANLRAACRAQGADLALEEVEKNWVKEDAAKVGPKSAAPAGNPPPGSVEAMKNRKYVIYSMSTWDDDVSLSRVKALKWLDDVIRHTGVPPEEVTRCLHLHIPFPHREQSTGQPQNLGYSSGDRSLYYVQDSRDARKPQLFDPATTAEIRVRKSAPQWIAARSLVSTVRGEFIKFLSEHLLTPSQTQKLAATAAGMASKPAIDALVEELYGKGNSMAASTTAFGQKAVRLPHLIHAFKLVQITSLSPLQLRADVEDEMAQSSGGVDPDEEEFYANGGHSTSKDHVSPDEDAPGERKPKGRGSWKEYAESSARGGIAGASNNADKMEAIMAGLDKYEKKMKGNVIPPESIDVRFRDVHLSEAAIRTIQKTIILPLIRPELFSSGVLSRQQISGILLFGPPGTGKTLLAKAVARESGCTMMNVDLSSLLAKWVGESEKNIRAVFTLAAKLAPTVLFVDELDALFSARRSDTQEYRRSAVNEFMAAWDGLQSAQKGVVVLGATNRPFDLDDAVLRRLPRRILVDLPNRSAREAIFRIHLRDQLLSPDVDIADLAARTDKWSGSDIKNLCVTAAVNAVSEHADSEILQEIEDLNAQKLKRDAEKRREEERRKGAFKKRASGTKEEKPESTGSLEFEASQLFAANPSISAEASPVEADYGTMQTAAVRRAACQPVSEDLNASEYKTGEAEIKTEKADLHPAISSPNMDRKGQAVSVVRAAAEDTTVSSSTCMSEAVRHATSTATRRASTTTDSETSTTTTATQSMNTPALSNVTGSPSSSPVSEPQEATPAQEGILLTPPEPFPGYVDYGMLSALRREASHSSNLPSRRSKKRASGGPSSSPAAAATAPSKPGDAPAKMIRRRHFEQSFLETTSSVSDEMESVIALRRWDAKYGGTRLAKRVGQQGKIGFVEHPPAAAPPSPASVSVAPVQVRAQEAGEGSKGGTAAAHLSGIPTPL